MAYDCGNPLCSVPGTLPYFIDLMYQLCLFLWLVSPAGGAQKPKSPARLAHPDDALAAYRQNLTYLRAQQPNHRDLTDLRFFLFGMGNRRKLIYRNGELKDARTGAVLYQWPVRRELIIPSEYTVHLETTDGRTVQIREDERSVWIMDPTRLPNPVEQTMSPVRLPGFKGHPYGPVLRVLHHEVLINVLDGKPLPNFLVYNKPWYRDATLMGMVLKQTGNLPLIRDWVMAIRDPFDRNNHGVAEADNPGEVLYLISLVSDRRHPAVGAVLDSVQRFVRGNHIAGQTDYAEHPVFQTKWLKYGLRSLGLPDPYRIPAVYDSYSSLFWWDYTDQHVAGQPFADDLSRNYPYLVWAEDHFLAQTGQPKQRAMVGLVDYPLSWEQQASDARYAGMAVLDTGLVQQKLSYPHTWHAAEMFLSLLNQR